ncbi:MAG TPA: hypothetical protein VJ784_12095 [Pyrinomonadaceae bacterium]|jgi:hypothetical protein|nr:hypothetical protein [Pyrinomonadaceae bacterium]
MSSSVTTQLPLAPLGAGDLIDRAVRLYRRHLFVLIRTAAPPIIIVAAGWVLFSISIRQIFRTYETSDLLLNVFLLGVAAIVMVTGYLFMLVVMGGATRTLVAHLLRNDPVTARATYNAVRARFWGLFGASLITLFWIFAAVFVSSSGGQMIGFLTFIIVGGISLVAPGWFAAVIMIVGMLLMTAVSLWLFFVIVARIVYVPQVMLVEGKGVFDAVSRSFTLASGNVRRLMAMTLFTTFGIMSALLLLLVIIGFVGAASGINMRDSTDWPVWYAILYSTLGPLSSVLLTPVWMLGLSLLYVDERVRHEGYDIELMASQQLGELPDVNVISPLGTALHSMERKQPPPPPSSPRPSGHVLNING